MHTMDLHMGGTSSIITGLLAPNFLDPVMPVMILPEVRDPQYWWGGHMFADSAKKYIYSFTAFMTESIWCNTDLVKPEEITSWESLLDPKWKGKIAILDPRSPGAGESNWAFLLRIKGEPFLAKLAAQEMTAGRNLRQLGEAVARGKSAISIGVSYYTYVPFIKAGLPVRSISNIKEGYYAATGSGNLADCTRTRLTPTPPKFLSTGCCLRMDNAPSPKPWDNRHGVWTWTPNGQKTTDNRRRRNL